MRHQTITTTTLGSDVSKEHPDRLLSLGVQLGYVSQQLGHADVAVTARHYARWCGGDVYREPLQLEAGEAPADLLARIVESPQCPPTLGDGLVHDAENPSEIEGLMVAQARVELATPAFSEGQRRRRKPR